MTTSLDILVIDDDLRQATLLAEAVMRLGHHATAFSEAAPSLDHLRRLGAHLVITDLRMPRIDGLDLLKRLKEIDPDLAVLLVTGYATVQTAVEAMRLGALDYLEKPVDMELLKGKLEIVGQHIALKNENRTLRAQIASLRSSGEILGKDERFIQVLAQLDRAAPSLAPVLIQGETGTGKELLARRLHEQSPRARHPFVAVNCGAIPETLIESEFFGHIKGAFTGADRIRAGRIEEAAGGTLFLDEIGELPLALQPKLLRVLQNSEYNRLGDSQARKADVRWVTATHRDLEAMVREGRFREDLYYRIAVIPVRIPPLRERTVDLPLLITELMARKARQYRVPPKGFTEEAIEALCAWKWPGNVRELENTIERLLLLSDHAEIDLGDLPERFGEIVEPVGKDRQTAQAGSTLPERVDDLERRLIAEALAASGGNQSEAARRLGIHERTLRYKLRKLSVPSPMKG